MSRLAYILYVVAVLLISGLARAHADIMPLLMKPSGSTFAPHITGVSASSQAPFQLRIDGYLPDPSCGEPVIRIRQSPSQPGVLIVELTAVRAVRDGLVHTDPLKPFSEVVDVATLVAAAQIPVKETEQYLVETSGYAFAMQAQGSDLIKK